MFENITEEGLKKALVNEKSIECAAIKISKELNSNVYDISKLAEALGFALVSPVVENRVNATKLLSSILRLLPPDFLNETQLEYLVTFYTNRMKDHHNVLPAVLDGISALIIMQQIPNNACAQMLQSFFQNVSCQSHLRNDREKIFRIFQLLTDNHSEELKNMKGDFVYGVISSIDGERDPRNLDFIFSFIPHFIKIFPLLHLGEEMFEVLACYYPIDFNPSANDPSFITRDQLADKLGSCLVASEEFVDLTIPLVLEKLESDLVVAKLDSLELLCRSVNKFNPLAVQTHFDDIWKALKVEIFPGGDNAEVIKAGLRALQAFLEAISIHKEESDNDQTIIMGSILLHLNDANHRLFEPSSLIALACVAGDPNFAAEKILNCFLTVLENTNVIDNYETLKILKVIGDIFEICSKKNQLNSINNANLQELQNQLIKIANRNDLQPELQRSVLNCLEQSLIVMTTENRNILHNIILKILTDNNISVDIRTTIKKLAAICPDEFRTNIFEKILKKFSNMSTVIKNKIFINLSVLIANKEFETLLLDFILHKIFESEKSEDIIVSFNALINLLETNNQEQKFAQKLQQTYDIIDKIFLLNKNSVLSMEIMEKYALVLNLIVRQLSVIDQKMLVDKYLPQMNLQSPSNLYFTKGLLGFMHQDVDISDHFENLIFDLTNISFEFDDNNLRMVCHHLLCSLLNKAEITNSNETIIVKILEKVKHEISKNNKKAVEILSWIAKGLSLRGYSSAGDIVQTISDLLNDPTLSEAAALAFEVLCVEFPQLHLPVVKYLYKQKFFHTVIVKIENKLELLSENHLKGFIYVLKATPHAILKMNVEKVGVVLFKCLDLNSANTLCIALDICKNFIEENDEYFRIHLNHLIPQCIKLSQFKESMKVRIEALNVLEKICKYPTYVLLGFIFDVRTGLIAALDDKKRLVRNAAVKTRNAWYIIDAPKD